MHQQQLCQIVISISSSNIIIMSIIKYCEINRKNKNKTLRDFIKAMKAVTPLKNIILT